MDSPVDFSPVARVYRLLETIVFGRSLQRRRCAFLSEVAGATRILILGEGDGRFAAEYARLNRRSHLQIVDISPGMQRVGQERLRRAGLSSGRIEWTIADARTVRFDGPYDLVVTHFFLDCFGASELKLLIPRVVHCMTAGGRWLISEFQLPERGLWRLPAKALVWTMYKFFGHFANLQTQRLPRYAPLLQVNGLRREKRQTAGGGLLVSELWRKGH